MITKAMHLNLAKWAAIGVLFLQCGICAGEAGKTEKGAGGREEKDPLGFAGRWVFYWPGDTDDEITIVTYQDGKYKVPASGPKTKPYKVDNVHLEGNILKFTTKPDTATCQYKVTLKDANTCQVVMHSDQGVSFEMVWRREGFSGACSPCVIRGAFECRRPTPQSVPQAGGASIWVFYDDGYCIEYAFGGRSTLFLKDGTYELRKWKNPDSYELILSTGALCGYGTLTLLPKAADGKSPGFSFVQQEQKLDFLSTDKAEFQKALKGATGLLDFRHTRKKADWKVIDTEGPNVVGEKPKEDAKSDAAQPRATVHDTH